MARPGQCYYVAQVLVEKGKVKHLFEVVESNKLITIPNLLRIEFYNDTGRIILLNGINLTNRGWSSRVVDAVTFDVSGYQLMFI